MLTVAEPNESGSGTVKVYIANELDTTIPEIIFVCLLCSSFGTLGTRTMEFGSGSCAQKERRRPK